MPYLTKPVPSRENAQGSRACADSSPGLSDGFYRSRSRLALGSNHVATVHREPLEQLARYYRFGAHGPGDAVTEPELSRIFCSVEPFAGSLLNSFNGRGLAISNPCA